MKKYIQNIILIVCLTVFALVIVFQLSDINSVINTLSNTDYRYILLGLAILVLYLFLFPLSLHIITRSKKYPIPFFDSMCIGASEFFFNNITPFSTGGQPFQVYAFNAKKITPSQSTSILMINFMVYQIALNLFGLYAIIRYYGVIYKALDNLPILIMVGFGLNMLILVLLMLLATTKRARLILAKLMRLICKIRFIGKRLSPKIDSFNEYTLNVQVAFKEMIKDFKTLFLSLVVKLISLACFYSIPFFAFKAIGVSLEMKDIFYITAMTSFVLTMVIWFPSPGASGATEVAFTALFVILPGVDESISASGMIIWRFMTYYVVMIFGFIMYLLFEKRRKKDENRNIY